MTRCVWCGHVRDVSSCDIFISFYISFYLFLSSLKTHVNISSLSFPILYTHTSSPHVYLHRTISHITANTTTTSPLPLLPYCTHTYLHFTLHVLSIIYQLSLPFRSLMPAFPSTSSFGCPTDIQTTLYSLLIHRLPVPYSFQLCIYRFILHHPAPYTVYPLLSSIYRTWHNPETAGALATGPPFHMVHLSPQVSEHSKTLCRHTCTGPGATPIGLMQSVFQDPSSVCQADRAHIDSDYLRYTHFFW